MKINRIVIYQQDLELKKPYWLSGGRLKFEKLDSTFVCIETDSGISGWGEACPWGVSYLPAFGKGIRAGMKEVIPAIINEDPRHIKVINRKMDLALPGHPYIKSAIDMACWDIHAQAAQLPLVQMLGGREQTEIPIASSVSTDMPDNMLQDIKRFRELGYKLHSAKVGADVETDRHRIRHMHENQVAGECIFYDVNRAWLPLEAITVLNSLKDIQVIVEQPCETLSQCLHVKNNSSHTFSIDECLKDLTDLQFIIDHKLAEIVNIKINRVGGISKALQMRDQCIAHGITMLIMDTGGGPLSDSYVAHFSQTIPEPYCLGTWSCQEMLSKDTAPGQGARNIKGCLQFKDQPGIGVIPDPNILGDPVQVYSNA